MNTTLLNCTLVTTPLVMFRYSMRRDSNVAAASSGILLPITRQFVGAAGLGCASATHNVPHRKAVVPPCTTTPTTDNNKLNPKTKIPTPELLDSQG
jgi:hypothetical protein